MRTIFHIVRGGIVAAAASLGIWMALLLPVSCYNSECQNKTYYGPAPCQSDVECVEANGEGWYCDQNHIIDQECNVTWPTCVNSQ